MLNLKDEKIKNIVKEADKEIITPITETKISNKDQNPISKETETKVKEPTQTMFNPEAENMYNNLQEIKNNNKVDYTKENVNQDEGIVDDVVEHKESSMMTYFDEMNTFAYAFNHNELFTPSSLELQPIDFQNPKYEKMLSQVSPAERDTLLAARSPEHFENMFKRQVIVAENREKINNDNIVTQVAMGAAPAVLDLTNAIPFAAFNKVKVISNLLKVAPNRVAGAIEGMAMGAGSNYASEMTIGTITGADSHEDVAAVFGAVLGGTIGGIVGRSLAPSLGGKSIEELTEKEVKEFKDKVEDTLNPTTKDDSREFVKEGNTYRLVSTGEEIAQSEADKQTLLDKTPFIGEWLASDMDTVKQITVDEIRAEGDRIGNGTRSQKDKNGNTVANPYNAINVKGEAEGLFITLNNKLNPLYARIKGEEKFKGKVDEFEVHGDNESTRVIDEQEAITYNLIKESDKKAIKEVTAEYQKEVDAFVQGELKKFDEEAKTFSKDLDDLEIEVYADIKGRELSGEAITKEEALLLSTIKHIERKEKDINIFLEELTVRKNLSIRKKKFEYADQIYKDNQIEFNSGSKIVDEFADAHRVYYKDALIMSKKKGVEGAEFISEWRHYRPRMYNYNAIKNKEITKAEAWEAFRESLRIHPEQAEFTSIELDKAADAVIDMYLNGEFNAKQISTSLLISKEMGFDKRLLGKKLMLNENALGPLIYKDLKKTTGLFNMNFSGKVAMAHITNGKTEEQYLKHMTEMFIKAGDNVSEKQINAFHRILSDVRGELRIQALGSTKPFVVARNIKGFNSFTLMQGAGILQAVELSGALMGPSSKALFAGNFGTQMKNVMRVMFNDSKYGDEFSEFMMTSGFLSDTLNASRANRMSDYEAGLLPGQIETKIKGVNDTAMKWNAMRPLIGIMESQAGASIFMNIKSIAKKKTLTKTEENQLGRWGLTFEDTVILSKEFEMHTDLKIGKFDINSMQPENRRKFLTAIQNGVSEIVVQGDSIHLPSWMKTAGPLTSIATQFLRFPLIANNVLLRKGYSEDQANMVSGIVGSILAYMTFKYLREQAAFSLGFIDEKDLHYNYYGKDGNKSIQTALLGGIGYSANLGALVLLYNTLATISGNPDLGREGIYTSTADRLGGPTVGLINDTSHLISKFSKGEELTPGDYNKIWRELGLGTAPIISEGFKSISKELGK